MLIYRGSSSIRTNFVINSPDTDQENAEIMAYIIPFLTFFLLLMLFNACDQDSPVVIITYPLEGDVMEGLDVITADAYDNGGKVVDVTFYIDGDSIGVDYMNHGNLFGMYPIGQMMRLILYQLKRLIILVI